MAKSTGLRSRRAHILDAEQVLVGYVGPGARGRAAETRTGAARILTTRLEAFDVFKAICVGQSSDAAGGYILEVAHVPLLEGYNPQYDVSQAQEWTAIASIEVSAKGPTEVPVSGVQIADALGAELSAGTEPRVVAIRATAGTGTNGAAAPDGTMTIFLDHR